MSEPTTHVVTNVRGDQVELEDDWGVQAQRAAEAHIAECWDWVHGEDPDLEADPSVGGFCGGTDCVYTCEVREVLYAALPFIEAGLKRDGAA